MEKVENKLTVSQPDDLSLIDQVRNGNREAFHNAVEICKLQLNEVYVVLFYLLQYLLLIVHRVYPTLAKI